MEKNDAEIKKYPIPTIRRMPSYLRVIRAFDYDGRELVSATDIAQELGLDPITVRKDLAYAEATGRPRVGYRVAELRHGIRAILGWDRNSAAILVGAGCLGSALLGFPGFARRGLNFVAAFDADPAKSGTLVHECPVLPPAELDAFVTKHRIAIAVLTVPAAAAQEVTDRLVGAGIRGIWNFSPVSLKVPPTVVVQTENLMSGLAVFMVRMGRG
ncbi:MAG: redox-sensing transcriptional repressor Rex, partial [Victivallales bacterium]|nr:redox-sensing transcriptional repressor Rex [Victivallales bacterium]